MRISSLYPAQSLPVNHEQISFISLIYTIIKPEPAPLVFLSTDTIGEKYGSRT